MIEQDGEHCYTLNNIPIKDYPLLLTFGYGNPAILFGYRKGDTGFVPASSMAGNKEIWQESQLYIV